MANTCRLFSCGLWGWDWVVSRKFVGRVSLKGDLDTLNSSSAIRIAPTSPHSLLSVPQSRPPLQNHFPRVPAWHEHATLARNIPPRPALPVHGCASPLPHPWRRSGLLESSRLVRPPPSAGGRAHLPLTNYRWATRSGERKLWNPGIPGRNASCETALASCRVEWCDDAQRNEPVGGFRRRYLVEDDFGTFGIGYTETDTSEADRETIVAIHHRPVQQTPARRRDRGLAARGRSRARPPGGHHGFHRSARRA
jgi:hypothetical protein